MWRGGRTTSARRTGRSSSASRADGRSVKVRAGEAGEIRCEIRFAPWRGTPTPLGVCVWPSQPERRVSPRQVCGTAEPRSRGACVRPPLDYVCSQPARAPATNMPRLRASNGTTSAQPPRGAPSHHSHSLQRGAAPELERAREGSQISSSTQYTRSHAYPTIPCHPRADPARSRGGPSLSLSRGALL